MSWLILDGYGPYVWSSYGISALILAWLVWSTLSANARTRNALSDAERERRR